jgi:hypothetical protein
VLLGQVLVRSFARISLLVISFFVVAVLFCVVHKLFCATSFPVESPRRRLHVDPFFVAADPFFARTRSGSHGT